jgi:hypothetical protein
MKKFFITALFLFLIFHVHEVQAQSATCTEQTCDTRYNPANDSLPKASGPCLTLTDEAAIRMRLACSQLLIGSDEYKTKNCPGLENRCPAPAGTVNAGAPATAARNGGSTATGSGSEGSGVDVGTVCSDIKFKSVLNILIWIKCVISAVIIPLIFSLAFLFFLWGIFKFMAASDSTKKEQAKNYIWWGLVGLFVMVSLWGIIRILNSTLGIDSTVPLLQTSALDPKKATK